MINLEAGYAPPLSLKGEGDSVVSGQLTHHSTASAVGGPHGGAPAGSPSTGGALLSPIGDLFPGSAHPGVCFFHFFFKCLSLLSYFLGSTLFGSAAGGGDFAISFVVTTVLLALDFWTVKNVSGRKLVGLCWQHRVAEDGSGEWTFQKAPAGRQISAIDYRIFWGGVLGWAVLWFALFINSFVSLDLLWSLIAIVGLALSGTNFVAFYKCARSQSPTEAALSSWGAATWRHAVMSRLGLS